jgi:hypothetical protein
MYAGCIGTLRRYCFSLSNKHYTVSALPALNRNECSMEPILNTMDCQTNIPALAAIHF